VLTKKVWKRTQKSSHFETASNSFSSKTWKRLGNAVSTRLRPTTPVSKADAKSTRNQARTMGGDAGYASPAPDHPHPQPPDGNGRHRCGGGWVGPRRLTLMGYFPVLLSDKLMSCCAADTNGCLDLRRLAFALDGQGGCWVEQVSKLHGTAS